MHISLSSATTFKIHISEKTQSIYPQTPTWPTTSGLTEQSVNNTCTSAVENMDGYDRCKNFPSIDFESAILDCMNDVQRTDSTAWAEASLQSLQASCRNAISSDEAQWVDNAPDDPNVSPALSDTSNSLCPSDCNGQGTCAAGT